MVKNRKIYIIQQIILGYLCLTLTVFSSVKSPVLCFESDGHVNIETNCDSDCEVPKDNEHQDDCVECFDVQLWDTNSNNEYFVKSLDFDPVVDGVYSDFNIFVVKHHFSSAFETKESHQENIPPFIKTTILLI